MKNQTAIEWLVNEANLLENNGWILSLIEQAKAMEKQKIESAYREGYNDCSLGRFADAEKYYYENFGL